MKSIKGLRESSNLNKGITLIALIITIIVLLILAGVTIAMVVGNNGIIAKAQTAKERTNESQAAEENKLADYENKIDNYVSGASRFNVQTTDLWSGNAAAGSTITLSESYKNFKELVVYYGNPNDNSISKQTFELSTLNWINTNNRSLRVLWYYNEYVDFAITNETTFAVNGNYVATIMKITGINYQ